MKRDITRSDPLCDSLSHSSLTDAGFTDQAGIIFLPARKNLNHTRDLSITSDYVVHLPLLSLLAEIGAVAAKILRFLLLLTAFLPVRPGRLLRFFIPLGRTGGLPRILRLFV